MKLKTPFIPVAKLDNLVVQEFSDEILIYNLENNKAYSLNETTTLVWQQCDGKKDVSQIAKEIGEKLNQTVPDEMVWLALDSLKKENLVSFNSENSIFAGLNRREVIRRVGLASIVALPMIASIVAPSAINAASGSIAACLQCNTGLGVGQGVCPSACANLTCTCFGNNSCNGQGQPAGGIGCEPCRTVGNSDKNNSFRCV